MDTRCAKSLVVNFTGLTISMAMLSAGLVWSGIIVFVVFMLVAIRIA